MTARTTSGVRVTWWGHSTVLVQLDGATLLADPLLRHRTGWLRRSVPVPDACRWDQRTDAVLVSHLHHDHCDLPTLRRLRAPTVLAPVGAGSWLRSRGVPGSVELPLGSRRSVTPRVTVTAVPAHHSGRREPFGPVAEAVGHLVEGPSGTVWICGDTDLYDGMADLRTLTGKRRIDLALVPVWGWGPGLGAGHLDPERAARAVALSGAAHTVPVHWGTLHPWGLGRAVRAASADPGARFVQALAALPGEGRAHLLPVGGTLELTATSSRARILATTGRRGP
jgi:L-ascorbate metabolism protein UlaG (beta-lactamase superfamily)